MTYEEAIKVIPAGHYRHFKGNYYKVLSIVRHSETGEPMVLYQALYDNGSLWVRPADMWNEAVERDGFSCPRFQPLTREERISFYEKIFDELLQLESAEYLTGDLEAKSHLLEDYYTSGEWLEDYEADEAGLLPADLKRGVLSQDSVYDLMERLEL